ncbi:MAG: site-specific DNA-methyltransferase [Candidatus Helarchaeota archaeon]|nr:site-specific DNA-methyltransferase [Candidatus Helarchaeota archaeon]
MVYRIIHGVCETELSKLVNESSLKEIHLTFLHPPVTQPKEGVNSNKQMTPGRYWQWMQRICQKILTLTAPGGALYFMHRARYAEFVLQALRTTGWTLQNLITWKQLTSVIPHQSRFFEQAQLIAFASKGPEPRVFHRLRIDSPIASYHKQRQDDGFTVTDVWNDIPELNIDNHANNDATPTPSKKPASTEAGRFPKEQMPVRLLTRIILASSLPHDLILDPFAGTGVTGVVAEQLGRNSITIELDPRNIEVMKKRLTLKRPAVDLSKFYYYYRFTDHIDSILPLPYKQSVRRRILHSLGNHTYFKNKN